MDAHSCLQTMVRGYGLQNICWISRKTLVCYSGGKVATIELQKLFLVHIHIVIQVFKHIVTHHHAHACSGNTNLPYCKVGICDVFCAEEETKYFWRFSCTYSDSHIYILCTWLWVCMSVCIMTKYRQESIIKRYDWSEYIWVCILHRHYFHSMIFSRIL